MAEEEQRIDIAETMRALARDKERLVRMVQTNPQLTAGQVMTEVAQTLMPYMQDLAALVLRGEEFDAWAGDLLETHEEILADGAPGEQSQLLPEDADKFRQFTLAVRETCLKSLEHVPVGSEQHNGLQVIGAGADEILRMIDDFELREDPAPDAGAPPPPPQVN